MSEHVGKGTSRTGGKRGVAQRRVHGKRLWETNTHDLQLHRFPLQLNRPDLEVHPDRAQVAVRERVFREPQEQT